MPSNKPQFTGDIQALPLGSHVVTAIRGRPVVQTPPSPNQALVWNGSAWTPSNLSPSGLAGFPNDVTTVLRGDGTWQAAGELSYDQLATSVAITGTASSTATTVLATSHVFDGHTVMAEFFCPTVELPAVAASSMNIALFDSGTLIVVMSTLQNTASSSFWLPVLLRYRFTPSAATHQYTIKAWVSSTTGTPTIFGGSGTSAPSYLRFTRATT